VPFVSHRTVRFAECDPARIVYFSRFFEYAHETYEAMLDAGDSPLSKIFSGEWAMPLVRSEADYKIPSQLGDPLELSLSVDKIGNRSFRYAVEIYGEDKQLRARVLMTHAVVSIATGKSCAVPEALLVALRQAGALE